MRAVVAACMLLALVAIPDDAYAQAACSTVRLATNASITKDVLGGPFAGFQVPWSGSHVFSWGMRSNTGPTVSVTHMEVNLADFDIPDGATITDILIRGSDTAAQTMTFQLNAAWFANESFTNVASWSSTNATNATWSVSGLSQLYAPSTGVSYWLHLSYAVPQPTSTGTITYLGAHSAMICWTS